MVATAPEIFWFAGERICFNSHTTAAARPRTAATMTRAFGALGAPAKAVIPFGADRRSPTGARVGAKNTFSTLTSLEPERIFKSDTILDKILCGGTIMVSFLLKGLAEEKIVLSSSKSLKIKLPARGILRIVNKKGQTLAVLLDKATIDDLQEELESSAPKFLATLERSRNSGRASSAEIKRSAGL